MTTFKLISNIFIWILVTSVACSTQPSQAIKDLNGFYVGLEEICWTDSSGSKECFSDPSHPERKWYHLTYLKIKGDSVYIDQNPISIYKTDTAFSASTGAFYYYNGTVQLIDTTIIFSLKELSCDYCPHEIKVNSDGTREEIKRVKQLKGQLTDKGVMINSYLFLRTLQKENLISEHSATTF